MFINLHDVDDTQGPMNLYSKKNSRKFIKSNNYRDRSNYTVKNEEKLGLVKNTGSTGDSYHTMAITALYELSAGNSVKVVVEGNTDSSYTIQSESQFWGYLVA